MSRCSRCGQENPARATRCRGCRAPLRGAAGGDTPGAAPDLHSARTLIVPEELLSELRPPASPPGAAGPPQGQAASPARQQTSPQRQAAAPARRPAPPPQPPAVPGGRPPAPGMARGAGRKREASPPDVQPLDPPPVAQPPDLPGPWGTPTDRPRPVHALQHPARDKAAPRLDLSLPLPPGGPLAQHLGGGVGEGAGVDGATLLLEDSAGQPIQSVELPNGATRLGRTAGELLFRDDPWVAPTHAWLILGPPGARLRDAGTLNGVYLWRDGASWLQDGDALVVGSQLLLLRERWSEPQLTPEGVEQFGSAGWTAPLRLVNLRAGGDVVQVHLLLEPEWILGRDTAEIYRGDAFLARQHLAFERTPDGVRVRDISGGRGYFVRLRGEAWVADGQPFLVGGQRLRLRFHRH